MSTGVEQNRITGTSMLAKRILSDFMNSCGRVLQSPLVGNNQVFRTVPTPGWFTLTISLRCTKSLSLIGIGYQTLVTTR